MFLVLAHSSAVADPDPVFFWMGGSGSGSFRTLRFGSGYSERSETVPAFWRITTRNWLKMSLKCADIKKIIMLKQEYCKYKKKNTLYKWISIRRLQFQFHFLKRLDTDPFFSDWSDPDSINLQLDPQPAYFAAKDTV